MKAKTFLTLDTETVGLKPVNYVYDLAYTIHDRKGNIAAERSFLVRDIITDADKMMGAFYAKKIFNFYIPALDAGEIALHSWSDIVATIRSDISKHGVDVFNAYNARFDMGAIAATNGLLASGKVLQKPVDILCLWTFACATLLNRPTYKNLARAQGWVSEAKNFRTTAEHTYRYISGDYDFIEGHTALSDARIETEIFAACMRQRKPIPYNHIPAMPWQIPNR